MQVIKTNYNLEILKEKAEHHKQLANIHFNKGNKDAALKHDNEAYKLDMEILDLMVAQQEKAV